MNQLGSLFVLGTFVASGAALGLALASLARPALLPLARRSVYVAWASCLAAVLVLTHLIVTHDFSNEYVASYSDLRMPLAYLLTAVWGGQKGSLLFWLFSLLGFGALAVFRHRKRGWRGEPWAIVSLMGIALFFGVCLLFAVDPFEQFLVLGRLPDGEGLNPLLQNPAMVYHPPTILAGYALWAVPFAYALAALIVDEREAGWLRALRTWNVAGWFLLTLGNLFGAFWAYTELGWGGFWGWDPVENASLMPWFTASALLHSAVVEERRGKFRLWNQALIFITFLLTLLGTFITRTGLIQSVHAFGSGTMLGVLFLVFMSLALLVWLGLVIWRRRALLEGPPFASWLSQELAFVAFNFLMIFATAVVLWGTLFPTLFQTAGGGKISIDAAWFNRFVSPIAIATAALLGVCVLLGWARSNPKQLTRWLGGSFGIALGVTLVEHLLMTRTFWYGGGPAGSPLSLLALSALFVSNLTLATAGLELWRGLRARRRGTGEPALTALLHLVLKARRRYAGMISHAAVALLIIGFSGMAYQIERDELQVREGETFELGDYRMTLGSLKQWDDGHKTITAAEVHVQRDGAPLATLHPAQFLFPHQSRQVTTEVDTWGTPVEDLYLALVGYDLGQKVAVLKVVLNPLVFWLWVSALLFSLGAALALLPERWARALAPGLASASAAGRSRE